MDIGSRIKELREEENLSQRELAEILEISRPSITKYERNEREPSYVVLLRISDYFGVSTDYILGKTVEKDRNIHLFNKTVTGLKNVSAKDFIINDKDLRPDVISSITGLLAEYLETINTANPISLDSIYLSTVLVDAINKYYYEIFDVLYDMDANGTLLKREIDSQTLIYIHNEQKKIASIFNDTLTDVMRFALEDVNNYTMESVYFINEIIDKFTILKGEEAIAERTPIYDLFKSIKK